MNHSTHANATIYISWGDVLDLQDYFELCAGTTFEGGGGAIFNHAVASWGKQHKIENIQLNKLKTLHRLKNKCRFIIWNHKYTHSVSYILRGTVKLFILFESFILFHPII